MCIETFSVLDSYFQRGSRITAISSCKQTLAGVRYVVDAGRAKAKLLEAGGALARYEVGWVSKAAAEQRAGRAGRMGPGHCYRYCFQIVISGGL